jgi:hypothetical protein
MRHPRGTHISPTLFRGKLAITVYGHMIYTAPYAMLLMRAAPFRWQVGGGWALEIESRLFWALWNGIAAQKSLEWMRIMSSSRVVRASDRQCRSRNCPGFDPSIPRHSGSEEWQTKQCWILYIKKANKNGIESLGKHHLGPKKLTFPGPNLLQFAQVMDLPASKPLHTGLYQSEVHR